MKIMKKTVDAGAVGGAAWAYLRVSTDMQDLENQRLEVLKLANERGLGQVRFIEETVSGRKAWREREIAGIMDQVKPGDALVVSELSRLGRSMLEVMELLAIAAGKGLRVYACKGGWSLDGTIQSKIMAMVLAMAAEIERDLISQRTKAALATKRAQGVRLGRPEGPGASKLDKHMAAIREQLGLGVPQSTVAKRFDTSSRNLSHWLAMRQIGKDGVAMAQ
jgi:DNA invertase Pin-like site-specific DNA recombinase